jgi:hypothetical protein
MVQVAAHSFTQVCEKFFKLRGGGRVDASSMQLQSLKYRGVVGARTRGGDHPSVEQILQVAAHSFTQVCIGGGGGVCVCVGGGGGKAVVGGGWQQRCTLAVT